MCRAVSGDSIPFIVYILQIADEDLLGEIFGFVSIRWARWGGRQIAMGGRLCGRIAKIRQNGSQTANGQEEEQNIATQLYRANYVLELNVDDCS